MNGFNEYALWYSAKQRVFGYMAPLIANTALQLEAMTDGRFWLFRTYEGFEYGRELSEEECQLFRDDEEFSSSVLGDIAELLRADASN